MSEAGKFSHDTSVIMATMVEFAQWMLTKRPTLARASERPNWLAARSPTRASEPRTEITRPKDVTILNPACRELDNHYACRWLEKRLNGERFRSLKSAVSCFGGTRLLPRD